MRFANLRPLAASNFLVATITFATAFKEGGGRRAPPDSAARRAASASAALRAFSLARRSRRFCAWSRSTRIGGNATITMM